MRRRLEQSDLSPTDIAAAYNIIEQQLKQGIFQSETEMRDMIRNPIYSMVGSLGAQFRAAFDAKCERTQQAGFLIGGDNKASEIYPAVSKSAGAVRNPDGSIDVGIIAPDAPNGTASTTDEPQDDSNGRYGEDVRVRNLPGGVTRVQMRSGASVKGLPLIEKSTSPTEKKAHEEYLRKVRAAQEGLPLSRPV